MTTLCSPLAKRNRLSLGNHCTPRKVCDNISGNFFPKTYSRKANEKASFSCNNFYGQERQKLLTSSPIMPMETDPMPDVNESSLDLEWGNLFSGNLESQPEKPALNISSLPNCGNTCYLNSVLHVLRYTPSFLEYLHHLVSKYEPVKKNEVQAGDNSSLACLNQLHTLYAVMRKREESIRHGKDIPETGDISKEVLNFIAVLRQATNQFEEDQQHDAHEFLAFLVTSLPYGLDKLNLTLNSDIESPAATPCSRRKKKRRFNMYSKIKYRKGIASKKEHEIGEKKTEVKISSPVPNGSIKTELLNSSELLGSAFDGQLCQIVQCLECEKKREMQEAFFDLKVPLAVIDNKGDSKIVALLDCLMKDSFLDGDNKYFCPNCLHYNEAKLSYRVVKSPSVLLLHLSWLSGLSVLTEEEKSGIQILVPLVLESSDEFTMFAEASFKFSLYAAIIHIGSTSADGHYVALIKVRHNHAVSELFPAQSTSSGASRPGKFLRCSDQCCSVDGFCELKKDTCAKKYSWYLFDDDNVSVLDVDDDYENLPYLEYLGPTASPYMLFYQRL